MRAPTVHLNGTSFEDLLANAQQALASALIARANLNLVQPNARDYYVQGHGALREAMEQWQAMYEKANDLVEELKQLVSDIEDQRPPKRADRTS